MRWSHRRDTCPSRYAVHRCGELRKVMGNTAGRTAKSRDRIAGRRRQVPHRPARHPDRRAMAQSLRPAAMRRLHGVELFCRPHDPPYADASAIEFVSASGYDRHAAGVTKLANTRALGARVRKNMWVRVPPPALSSLRSAASGPPRASPARADSQRGSGRLRDRTPRRAAHRPASPRPSTPAEG